MGHRPNVRPLVPPLPDPGEGPTPLPRRGDTGHTLGGLGSPEAAGEENTHDQADQHRGHSELARQHHMPPPGYSLIYDVVRRLPSALMTLAPQGSKAYHRRFDLLHRWMTVPGGLLLAGFEVSPKLHPLSQKGKVKKPQERRCRSITMSVPIIYSESHSAQARCILGARMMPRPIATLTFSSA
jgi:hypothetical protein